MSATHSDDFRAAYENEEQAQTQAEQKRQENAERARRNAEARREKVNGERTRQLEQLTETLGIKKEAAEAMIVPGRAGAVIYALNEDNLARVFSDRFGDRLRFSHDRAKWYLWDETRWREEGTDLAFDWARALCRSLNLAGAKTWAKASTAAAVERFARADRTFAMCGDEWDADPWALGTPGGTLDLRTGELRAAKQGDLITRSTLVAPGEGEPRLWRQFLNQVTLQDEEVELFLRQVAGYALTGDTREESLFFVYGPGGSGKSTFIGALHEILASYAVSAPMDAFLAAKFERHSTDIAMLRGARLVIASETREGRAWDEQRIKSLTGGDVITARFMRQDNFSYRPTFKLLLFGNHKPALRTVDDAWRRRFNVIPFTFRPATADNGLKERLRAEYPQILQWAIEGCLDWQKHGLSVPARVKAETEGYFVSQDQFGAWLDEACEMGRAYCETNARLFESWKRFCEAVGEHWGTARSLGDRLAERGFRRIKDEMGIRGRGFAGLRTKVSAADEYRAASDGD